MQIRNSQEKISCSVTLAHSQTHKNAQTHTDTQPYSVKNPSCFLASFFFNLNTVIQRMHHFRQLCVCVCVCTHVCVHVRYCFKLIILYHLTNSTCGDFPACHGGNFTFNIHSQTITHNKYLFIKSSLKQAMTRLHRNLSDVRNYALLVEMILREKMLIMCAQHN